MSLLLFGATGNAGKHVLNAALSSESTFSPSQITVFARNPLKIPEQQRNQISVIEGDYLDENLVKKTILDVKPTSIIISTALPRNSETTALNGLVVPRIVDALKQDERLAECTIIHLNDAFVKIPDKRMPLSLRAISFTLVPLLGIISTVRDDQSTVDYLYTTPSELKFSTVHMGRAEDKPSKGEVRVTDIVADSVSFSDVGVFLVKLAHDNSAKDVYRQGFYIGYDNKRILTW